MTGSIAGCLHGLAPIARVDTRVMVLGSFPGAASLAAGQYYAHPRNQFWPILARLWPQRPQPADYAGRCAWLLDHGIGLWDVYASCQRQGSLDSAIEHARVNDFAQLAQAAPGLRGALHNGAESFKHARAAQQALGARDWQALRVPSTSPANASLKLEAKLAAWRGALRQMDIETS